MDELVKSDGITVRIRRDMAHTDELIEKIERLGKTELPPVDWRFHTFAPAEKLVGYVPLAADPEDDRTRAEFDEMLAQMEGCELNG